MDKYIGRLLDNRYEILEVIGTGGMAVVYKARCHRLNRLVAVKILKDDFMEDEEFRRRFHSESQAVAMLSHPNIISVYDVSTSITADYIVMELIDGITLKQYMEKKGVLNWKETLHFAIQIAKALEHAHSRGIVHRDIKPHNVLVLKNGSVKVTDFGIARVMSKGNTLTKEALGSVHYISPEQAKGGRVDNRSDLYSLGVVMYEMMSGRPPYDGESPVSVAIQHINGGAAMPSSLNPNIPGGLEQIIMRAMALEPVNRYATATQMLADLDEFRKDPAMLFDYNTSTDDVIKVVHTPSVEPENTTAADRAVEKAKIPVAPVRRTTPPPQRRTPPGKDRQKRPEQSRTTRNSEDAKKNKVTTIAIISCAAVLAIALLIFVIVLLGDSPNVKVPNLVGKEFSALNDKGYQFNIKLDKEVYNDTVEAGMIISHVPAAGEEVVKNGTVYVVVSKGPQLNPVYMPDVTGKERDAAKKEIDDLGMGVVFEFKPKYSAEIAADRVIVTDPEPGVELKVGQTVTVYISQGKEPTQPSTMPNILGQTQSLALIVLEGQNMDLTWEIETKNDDQVPKDQVISTIPAAGEELKPGQKVFLTVSLGPKTVPMPKLDGMKLEDAKAALAIEGMNITLDIQYKSHSTVKKDYVITSTPAENEDLISGQTVTLYVSSGPAILMPDVEGKKLDEAKQMLKEAGIETEPKVVRVYDERDPDTVILQDVVEGTEITSTTQITLTVSDGPAPSVQPDPPADELPEDGSGAL